MSPYHENYYAKINTTAKLLHTPQRKIVIIH